MVVTHRYDRHDSPSRKKNSLGSSELFRATLGQSPELDIGGARYVLPTIIGRFDDGRPRSPTDDGGYFGGCGLAPPAPWPQHSRRHPRRADPRGGALRIGVLHHLQGKNHPTSRARRTTTIDASGGRAPRQVPCDRRCRNRLAGATTRAATSGRRRNGGRSCQRFRFPWHQSRAGFQLATSSCRKHNPSMTLADLHAPRQRQRRRTPQEHLRLLPPNAIAFPRPSKFGAAQEIIRRRRLRRQERLCLMLPSRIIIRRRGGESQSPRRGPLVLWAADGK